MEKEKEKQVIYNSLVELTQRSETPDIYFTRNDVLENIKKNIEEEKGAYIHYRSAYTIRDDKKIDLNEILPKKKTLPLNLEELSQEGKIQKIVISAGITGRKGNTKLYRALEENQ